MVTQFQRWKLLNKVFLVSLGIVLLSAWFDAQNLSALKEMDKLWQNSALWDIFAGIISPAMFSLWMGIHLAIALIWYIHHKDVSEALILAIVPFTLIIFGVQDLFYYLFSTDTLAGTVGCWADVMGPIKVVSNMCGESCPTAFSFTLTAGIGVFASYHLYKYLKKI